MNRSFHWEPVLDVNVDDTIFAVSLGGGPNRDERVVIAGADKEVKVFDVGTGAELSTTRCGDRVRTAVFASAGDLVASAGFDATIRVKDTHAGARVRAFPSCDTIRSVSTSMEGDLLAFGGDDKLVSLIRTETGQTLHTWTHTEKVWSVAVEPKGRWVAAGDYGNLVTVYDAVSGEVIVKHTLGWFIWSVSFSPDSRALAVACWDKTARVYATSDAVNPEDETAPTLEPRAAQPLDGQHHERDAHGHHGRLREQQQQQPADRHRPRAAPHLAHHTAPCQIALLNNSTNDIASTSPSRRATPPVLLRQTAPCCQCKATSERRRPP